MKTSSTQGVTRPSHTRPPKRRGDHSQEQSNGEQDLAAVDDVGERTRGQRQQEDAASVVAAWTSATMNGDGASEVISQPAPTSCIQVPMFETTVAVQSTVKAE